MLKSFCLSAVLCSAVAVQAQSDGSARFEIISIKRNTSGDTGNSGRSLPDGTQIMVNFAIRNILMAGADVPVVDVVGNLPDWVTKERYDITAKPPEGSDRSKTGEMMRNLLIDRMKLAGHIEQREQNTYALVLARQDGKLGPEMQPSTIDCQRRPGDPPPSAPPANQDYLNGCFSRMGLGLFQSGAVTTDGIAAALRMGTGGVVEDRTGLRGRYRVNLKYRRQMTTGAADVDDLPDIFTAVQEQLGLKLLPQKTMQNIFVIDHIERPTEN